MPFTLIKGTLRPDLGRPDGDSMRFAPDDPTPIFKLRRRGGAPEINRTNGSIQLRYEGIDTMESRALEAFSARATAANIDAATGGAGKVPAPGYILSTQLGPRGRPIAFVFAGDRDGETGDQIFLTPEDIEASINFRLLAAGHAYPLFYDTLFDDLRAHMSAAARDAEAAGAGVWAADETNAGATWSGGVESLAPIFPKLWRRIDTYVRDDGFFDPNAPFAAFKDWFASKPDERVIVPSTGAITGFDNLIETTDDTVRMTVQPRDLVVISR
ncbi:MAG: hypothetical protein AAFP78_06565 [Pseudomonadota bacterium]